MKENESVYFKERLNFAYIPLLAVLCIAVVFSISEMRKDYLLISAGGSDKSEISAFPVRPVVLGGIDFFRHYISPVDGARCSLYPTCSEYSAQAIEKRGLLMGVVMTFGRLMHEFDEKRIKQPQFIKGSWRVPDPLHENYLISHRNTDQ